jgi:hypothetical protein
MPKMGSSLHTNSGRFPGGDFHAGRDELLPACLADKGVAQPILSASIIVDKADQQ